MTKQFEPAHEILLLDTYMSSKNSLSMDEDKGLDQKS